MPRGSANSRVRIRMTNAESIRLVRTILMYEAAVRGRSMNQAAIELIFEAINVNEYPPEVRERLADLAEESRKTAALKALNS